MKSENFNNEMNFINAPQFPGQQMGAKSIEDVRNIIKRQKRLKGYDFQVAQGTSEFNLDLSGTARILLGIALFGESARVGEAYSCWCTFNQVETMSFTVNNEIVIDQLNPNFLSPQFNTNEYYFIPRPLSGTDILTLKFTNPGVVTEAVKVVLYYI
jgi:hypothetical protein